MLLPLLLLLSTAPMQDRAPDPTCSADIRWIVGDPAQVAALPAAPLMFGLSLFSAAGRPACHPAELRMTAAYFDAANELVCSGVVARAALLREPTQITNLEISPTNLFEFVRWRNGPAAASERPQRLQCFTPDGVGEIQQGAFERAISLRLYATIVARTGGIATDELRLALRRP
jgi:hypothetical protein